MNGAIIRGFEEDVGTKISFYGFTTNTMKNALALYSKEGFSEVPQSSVRTGFTAQTHQETAAPP